MMMMMRVAFAMTCMLFAITTADKECKLFFVEQESPPTAECCGWFSSRREKAKDRRRICRCMEFLTTAFEAIKPSVLSLSDQCHFGGGFPISKNHACASSSIKCFAAACGSLTLLIASTASWFDITCT
ncbi:hypothetical protein HID58_000830 [Brassica napus]|uniref:Bifunctional inhibitor/plant lipid transfer protein/seed storage helical domain-containing protein n=1 Tax=Brassica napus TaxID=3708 RepID=A0ABQ8EIA2_BRANA|nr:hypothetical protein HID58_000830 [Brassica napus]